MVGPIVNWCAGLRSRRKAAQERRRPKPSDHLADRDGALLSRLSELQDRGLRFRGYPLDRVDEDLPHLWTKVIVIRLMTWSEIKDPPFANGPAQPHPRRFGLAVGLGIKTVERHCLGGGDCERFAIPLDLWQFEISHAVANGMGGFLDDDLGGSAIRHVFPPTTTGPHQLLEWFRKMAGDRKSVV